MPWLSGESLSYSGRRTVKDYDTTCIICNNGCVAHAALGAGVLAVGIMDPCLCWAISCRYGDKYSNLADVGMMHSTIWCYGCEIVMLISITCLTYYHHGEESYNLAGVRCGRRSAYIISFYVMSPTGTRYIQMLICF